MKKIFKVILMLTLASTMVFANISMVFASNGNYIVSSYEELAEKIACINEGDEIGIKLDNDIEIKEPLVIDKACKISFKGCGYTLQTQRVRVFYLDADGIEMYFDDLTIQDVSPVFHNFSFQDDGQAFYINGESCIIDGVSVIRCGNVNYAPTGSFFDPFFNLFYSWNGGAIYINGKNCTVRNCYFESCRAQADGGAIAINRDGALIQACTFNGCTADSDGGAIYCCAGVDGVCVDNCDFIDCGWEDQQSGKNVYGRGDTVIIGAPADQRTDVWFYDCMFADNWNGSMISSGSYWIIGAGVLVAATAAFILIKKKKTAN